MSMTLGPGQGKALQVAPFRSFLSGVLSGVRPSSGEGTDTSSGDRRARAADVLQRIVKWTTSCRNGTCSHGLGCAISASSTIRVPIEPYVARSVNRDRTASMPTDGTTQRSTAPASSATPISIVPTLNAWAKGSAPTISSPSPAVQSTVSSGHCRAGAGASPGAALPPPSGRAVSRVSEKRREGAGVEPPAPSAAAPSSASASPSTRVSACVSAPPSAWAAACLSASAPPSASAAGGPSCPSGRSAPRDPSTAFTAPGSPASAAGPSVCVSSACLPSAGLVPAPMALLRSGSAGGGGGGLGGGAFRRLDHVDEQLGPGHGPDAARVRGDPRGDLGHTGVHVADDLAVLVPADADVQHGGARLHVLGLDQVGHTGGGDDDVRLPEVRRQVTGAGVALGDGRVLGLARQQQRQRPADGDTPSHDDHVGAVDLDAVTAEQGDDALRRAGQRAGL